MKKRVLLLGLTILILLSNQLLCDDFNKSKLPQILNSSLGTEFYFSFLPCWETSGYQGGLRIYVISNTKSKVTVEVPEKGFQQIKYTDSLNYTSFDLSSEIGQPYTNTPWSPFPVDNVYKKSAVHITSDYPIMCYAMTRYQFSSEGFIILPVSILGKEYIVSTHPDISTNLGQLLPAIFSVVATENKTKVFFKMGGTDRSKTMGGQTPGEETLWILNEGDVLTVASLGAQADLSGSVINSTKPVAIISGSYNTYVPTNRGSGNLLQEMELPTELWGTEYFIPHIYPKQKSSIIKIFVKEPKTNIYKNWQLLGMINNPGGTLGMGYLELRADSLAKTVVYSGDKPINISLYNTGATDDNTVGDPFKMTLVPIDLYQTEATFFHPGNDAIPIGDSYVTLIYQSDEKNKIPDNFEIAHVKDNKFFWEKLSKFSPGVGTKIEHQNSTNNYYSKVIKLKDIGIYKLKAKNKFQAYTHGFGSYDAYGYASFVGYSKFSEIPIDTIPPSVKSTIQDCGDIYGIVYDSTNKINFNSNLSTVYMYSNRSYNYKLYNDDFMPCKDSSANWRLERINKNEDAYATIYFMDCVGNDTTMFFEYADSNQFYMKSSTQEFNKVIPGTEAIKEFFVSNKSDEFPASIKSIKFKSTDSINSLNYFKLLDSTGNSDITFPISIPILDSIKFSVSFSTTKLGQYSDMITFSDECYETCELNLSANSKAGIIETQDLNFFDTEIGFTEIQELIINNQGNDDLKISDIILPNLKGELDNLEYNIVSSDEIKSLNISYLNPLIIRPDSSRKLQILFRPDSEKDYLDSIIISSNTLENMYHPDSVCTFKGKGVKPINVDENSLNHIAIFPNPVNDIINISNLPNNCNRIEIIDESGKTVRSIDFKYYESDLKISTKELLSGAYIIRFTFKNNFSDKKIIIAK